MSLIEGFRMKREKKKENKRMVFMYSVPSSIADTITIQFQSQHSPLNRLLDSILIYAQLIHNTGSSREPECSSASSSK